MKKILICLIMMMFLVGCQNAHESNSKTNTKDVINQEEISDKKETKTNAFSIIGKKALVIKNIDSINKSGQIKVNGEVWSAIGKNDDKIEKGTEVEVVSINGVKAVVKPASHS